MGMAAKPANLSSFFISIYLRYAPKNRFWIEAAMLPATAASNFLPSVCMRARTRARSSREETAVKASATGPSLRSNSRRPSALV